MYYAVCVKCGHVGKNYYVDKILAIEAESGKEAAAAARDYPRVKHHHKDAVRSVRKISGEEYASILESNRRDPYFSCRNIQQQRELCHLARKPEETAPFPENRKEPRNHHGRVRDKRISSALLVREFLEEEWEAC